MQTITYQTPPILRSVSGAALIAYHDVNRESRIAESLVAAGGYSRNTPGVAALKLVNTDMASGEVTGTTPTAAEVCVAAEAAHVRSNWGRESDLRSAG